MGTAETEAEQWGQEEEDARAGWENTVADPWDADDERLHQAGDGATDPALLGMMEHF